MDSTRTWSLLYATAAVLLGAVGLTFVVRPGGSAQWAYGLVALGVAFLALSAVPAVRAHDAYGAVSAAFATAVCGVSYLGNESLFLGLLTVFAAVGTLVELYNWWDDGESLRFA